MSEKWKTKHHIVMPKKNPALMSLKETLEWEKECLEKRISDMNEAQKQKFAPTYELRIAEINTILAEPIQSVKKLDIEEDIQSKVFSNPTKLIPKAEIKPEINSLLKEELKAEKKPKKEKLEE